MVFTSFRQTETFLTENKLIHKVIHDAPKIFFLYGRAMSSHCSSLGSDQGLKIAIVVLSLITNNIYYEDKIEMQHKT